MIHIEKRIIIQRPVEEDFTYVSDLTHSAEWQTGLMEVRMTTESPLGVEPGVNARYGKYLVRLGGCHDCHGKDFSGGKSPACPGYLSHSPAISG